MRHAVGALLEPVVDRFSEGPHPPRRDLIGRELVPVEDLRGMPYGIEEIGRQVFNALTSVWPERLTVARAEGATDEV